MHYTPDNSSGLWWCAPIAVALAITIISCEKARVRSDAITVSMNGLNGPVKSVVTMWSGSRSFFRNFTLEERYAPNGVLIYQKRLKNDWALIYHYASDGKWFRYQQMPDGRGWTGRDGERSRFFMLLRYSEEGMWDRYDIWKDSTKSKLLQSMQRRYYSDGRLAMEEFLPLPSEIDTLSKPKPPSDTSNLYYEYQNGWLCDDHGNDTGRYVREWCWLGGKRDDGYSDSIYRLSGKLLRVVDCQFKIPCFNKGRLIIEEFDTLERMTSLTMTTSYECYKIWFDEYSHPIEIHDYSDDVRGTVTGLVTHRKVRTKFRNDYTFDSHGNWVTLRSLPDYGSDFHEFSMRREITYYE